MFKNIYDIGANQGQNINYFLSNSEQVIVVEPIKILCVQIEKTFKELVKSGQ